MTRFFTNCFYIVFVFVIVVFSYSVKSGETTDGYRMTDLVSFLGNKSRESVELASNHLSVSKSTPGITGPYIIGGKPAPTGTFNDFAYILITDGDLKIINICGGTIIGKVKVLTAAQCAQEDASLYFVYPAFYYRTEFIPLDKLITVERAASHPEYNPNTLENDVAVLTLTKPVTSFILPHYPDREGNKPIHSGGRKFVGETGESLGVGISFLNPTELPDRLQIAEVPIRKNLDCNNSWKNITGISPIKKSMICAGSTDNNVGICNGDIGSPLYVTSGTLITRKYN